AAKSNMGTTASSSSGAQARGGHANQHSTPPNRGSYSLLFLISRSCHANYEFSFQSILFEVGFYFLQRSADRFLVDLGQLPGYRGMTARSKEADKLVHRFEQAVGGLVKDHRAAFPSQFFQPCLPSFLYREKTFEAEPVTG